MRKLLLWLFLTLVCLPPGLVLVLRFVPPPVTSFMLQSEVHPVRYDWVPAEQIANTARRAVVASEDQKFWEHDGFDIEAIREAQAHNRRGGRIRGASTISQQTAKNLFLWPGGGYFRKGVEAGFTVLIEWLWPKERILEVYLNVAEFGPGIYGVESASREFFHKAAASLSASEAARLAAVLPNPRKWSARSPGPYVQSRSSWILGQMGHGRRQDAEPPLPPGEVLPGEEPLPADPAGAVATQADDAAPALPPAELAAPDASTGNPSAEEASAADPSPGAASADGEPAAAPPDSADPDGGTQTQVLDWPSPPPLEPASPDSAADAAAPAPDPAAPPP